MLETSQTGNVKGKEESKEGNIDRCMGRKARKEGDKIRSEESNKLNFYLPNSTSPCHLTNEHTCKEKKRGKI